MNNWMKSCLHWIDSVCCFIMNEIKTTDIRGNGSTSLQLLNRAGKFSIGLALSPSSPSSTLTNATITLAGLRAKTISSTGVVTTNWYDSLGRGIMSGNLTKAASRRNQKGLCDVRRLCELIVKFMIGSPLL
ncbi:MAG: hypothetical protein PHO37_09900 [Kiritimatiellae bacterium]|nr:hypothetical protein [Kiritimatiellia bacterium]